MVHAHNKMDPLTSGRPKDIPWNPFKHTLRSFTPYRYVTIALLNCHWKYPASLIFGVR